MNWDIDEKLRRQLRISMLVVLIPMGIAVYWEITHSVGGVKRMLDNESYLSFNGKVDSIYRDRRNHNVKTVVLNGGLQYGLLGEWEPFIEVGDSLSKQKQDLLLKVYKKDGRLIILDYKKTIMRYKLK